MDIKKSRGLQTYDLQTMAEIGAQMSSGLLRPPTPSTMLIFVIVYLNHKMAKNLLLRLLRSWDQKKDVYEEEAAILRLSE